MLTSQTSFKFISNTDLFEDFEQKKIKECVLHPKIYGILALITIASHPSRELQEPGKGTRYRVVDGRLHHMYYSTFFGFNFQGLRRILINSTGGNASHDSLLGMRKELKSFIKIFGHNSDDELKKQARVFLTNYVIPGFKSLRTVYANTSMESEIEKWIRKINEMDKVKTKQNLVTNEKSEEKSEQISDFDQTVESYINNTLITTSLLKRVNDIFQVHFIDKSLTKQSMIRDIDGIVETLHGEIVKFVSLKKGLNESKEKLNLSTSTPPINIVNKRVRSTSASSSSPQTNSLTNETETPKT